MSEAHACFGRAMKNIWLKTLWTGERTTTKKSEKGCDFGMMIACNKNK